MKLYKKTALFLGMFLLITAAFPFAALAYYDSSLDSYSYFGKETVTSAPAAYSFDREISAKTLGVVGACEISDIKYSAGQFYLLDKAGGRVIILSDTGELKKVIADNIGLSAPDGFFVSQNGSVYIADTENGRIVKTDADGQLTAVVSAPDSKVTLSDSAFVPIKISVDSAERLYVLSRDDTNGIYQLGLDGSFYGFYGSVPVVPSFSELLWRSVSTKEQLSKMLLFIPTEYSGMDIDEEGFIYTTVSTNTDSEMRSFLSSGSKQLAPVRRLNPKGSDVLLRNGNIPPMGDVLFDDTVTRETMASKLTEIAVYKDGIYSVLDSTRCRVFTYDKDGNLLFEFGKKGDSISDLGTPEALCYYGDNIAVLDAKSGSVKLFKRNEYAAAIVTAAVCEKSGDYEGSAAAWNDVLSLNSGCQIAYSGKARQALRDKDYRTAMKLFRFADDTEGYSKAFSLYRNELGSRFAAPVIAGIILVAVLIFAAKRLLNKKTKKVKKESKTRELLNKAGYGFYIMRHPFDGFWDMSFESRGSLGGATVILAAVVVLNLLMQAVSGYLVSGNKAATDNLFLRGCAGILVPAALWCVANWSVTSLMNGSGNMKRIYMYTCYSLTPLLLFMPALIIISNVITLDEAALYSILTMLMYIWMAFLIFAGTAVVHQYSSGKTLLAIIVIFIAIAVILFLLLLCVTIFQQMSEFVVNISEEIALRN